jgi:hypothetical protein
MKTRSGVATVRASTLSTFASAMGRRSYQVRLQRFGIEHIRQVARINGRKGGRPRKQSKGA